MEHNWSEDFEELYRIASIAEFEEDGFTPRIISFIEHMFANLQVQHAIESALKSATIAVVKDYIRNEAGTDKIATDEWLTHIVNLLALDEKINKEK